MTNLIFSSKCKKPECEYDHNYTTKYFKSKLILTEDILDHILNELDIHYNYHYITEICDMLEFYNCDFNVEITNGESFKENISSHTIDDIFTVILKKWTNVTTLLSHDDIIKFATVLDWSKISYWYDLREYKELDHFVQKEDNWLYLSEIEKKSIIEKYFEIIDNKYIYCYLVTVAINKPTSYRAVGTALSKNPNAPTVPCHRVLPGTFAIGGFFGDSDEQSDNVKKKKSLLEKEGIKFDLDKNHYVIKKNTPYRNSIIHTFI